MKLLFKGILIFFMLISCQNHLKNNPKTKADNSAKTLTQTVDLQKNNLITSDTVDVQSRFLEGDKYQSHIKIDFAKIDDKIQDTSIMMIINKVCAVAVIPDTTWINKQQKSMPEDDWNTIVDDNEYYEQIATDTLDKLNIPTIFDSRDKRYVKFLKSNGTDYTIDLALMKDAWGLILFNGTDNPVLWRSTDIDAEIKEIYKK